MEEDEIRTDVVSLGSRVTLQEMKTGRNVTVTLVSSVESKLKDGKISMNLRWIRHLAKRWIPSLL